MDRVDTPPPGMVPPGMGGGPLPGMSAPPGTSVSFAEPPGESKLLALERTLAAKDAVMEPEVLATLRDYVANGGKPAAAIELLSENYRGYAQMTGLVCKWLEITEPEGEKAGAGGAGHQRAGSGGISAAVSPQAGRGSGAATPTFGRPAGAEDDDTPQGGGTMPRTGSAAIGLASGGQRGERANTPVGQIRDKTASALRNWRARVRKDEMWFLERLIRRKFDPRRVDAAKGRPAWMQRLLVSDRGRAVLFSLAEAHPNCLLITIAIQHAWQHGHADEVRALGPAAASYFSIFHELLAEHFTALIAAGDDEDRRAGAIDVIKRACTQSLATYLFAQMMLADLARGGDAGLPGGGSSKAVSALASRVSRELEGAAAATHGSSTVRKIAPLLAESDADAAATAVAGDLLLTTEEERRRRGTEGKAAGVAPPLPRGILKKLHALYVDDSTPPRDGSTSRDGSTRDAIAPPPGMGAGPPPGMGMAPPSSNAKARERPGATPLRQPELLRSLFDEAFRCNVGAAASADPGRAESRAQCVDLIVRAVTDGGEDEAAEARRALESASKALEAAARGSAPEPESFRGLVGYPPAAAGVIAWVSSAMGDPEHYRQVHAGASNQVYFGMLARAAVSQPRLRERALDAVGAALAAMGKGSSEALHLGALDVAVEMVEAGHVLPVIEAATERWSRHVDPSHLRYFAGEVLEVAGPPYGGRFASAMVRLLRAANARRGTAGMNPTIDEFVAQVRRQREGGRLHPNLAKEDDTFLEDLAK